MLRNVFPLFALLFVTPALAQNARPAAISSVGPWESVMWVRGGKVERCTLARSKPLADGTSYGLLIDREVLFGVNNPKWAFVENARLQPLLTPSSGSSAKVVAQAVAPTRANITMPRAMLDDLQKSEHLDVEVAGSRSACRSTISMRRGWCWKSACRRSASRFRRVSHPSW